MGNFRRWLTEELAANQQQVQQIWADTFQALGVGGLTDEDAAQQSLSRITFNNRNVGSGQSVAKGKEAVRKRLENGQILDRLSKLDPEAAKRVEDTRRWLDMQGEKHTNASSTLSVLLQKMFGDEAFSQLINSNAPKAQPRPTTPTLPPRTPPTPTAGTAPAQPQPPVTQVGAQQPQAVAQPQTPPAQAPMPPRPAGAELGIY